MANSKNNKELSRIKKIIAKTLRKYKIKKAGIFGSYVRGDQKKKSDIDVLVEIPKNKKFSLLDFSGIKIELQDNLGRKVDLVEYKMIKPRIRDHIINEEIRII